MLDAARLAVVYASEHSRDSLDVDPLRAHGLIRLVEIIGEAAGRVSVGTQAELPDLPWSAMVGMRNRLVHGYYETDLDVVWNTLVEDLPPLCIL
jgi:uncharacterized protein with HEPN domain